MNPDTVRDWFVAICAGAVAVLVTTVCLCLAYAIIKIIINNEEKSK